MAGWLEPDDKALFSIKDAVACPVNNEANGSICAYCQRMHQHASRGQLLRPSLTGFADSRLTTLLLFAPKGTS